jgi:hypothetical protein
MIMALKMLGFFLQWWRAEADETENYTYAIALQSGG